MLDGCEECDGLELVLGGEIYAVDLTPRTENGGRLVGPHKKFNDISTTKWYPRYTQWGYATSMTSVADFNQDGHLDVVMAGSTGSGTSGATYVYFWDVHNNTGKTFRVCQGNTWNSNCSTWAHGTGRINLADVDGDGKMNATFVSGKYIYSLKEDFTLLWRQEIHEQTSGFTSTTVFDFNNDNAVEVVYRDEEYLYIIDGKTGVPFTQIVCQGRTANEYPIVVDVDGDGATEICVSCYTRANVNVDNDTDELPKAQIRMYKSALEPWVSARKVWNQYAYFNVNVNDDLTIPQFQQDHHLVFSPDPCSGGVGPNRPMNSFLNQSAILDSKGCKTYPSADVAFIDSPLPVNVVPPTCPGQDFTVSFTIQNVGDLDLSGDLPVTFYAGDPLQPGATKLKTETIALGAFRRGDQIHVENLNVTGTGSTFELFVVLNDNGSTTPSPITLPNSPIGECDLGNNIASATVVPAVFNLASTTTDHLQCGADPATPNGTASVFKPEGGVQQTVGYTFYWFDGTTAGPHGSAVFTGPTRTGLAPGTYTVYALHDAFQCSSDTVQVTVGSDTRNIAATIQVDHAFTNCMDPDGKLSVVPSTGDVDDYTYEWFEGTVFGTSLILSHQNVLDHTRALTYSVLVTEKATGCETLVSATVPNETITPDVTTSMTPANCEPTNSGIASASVSGTIAGYEFFWYDGVAVKASEDYLGDTYENIEAGDYTVVARNTTTGCTSTPTVVTVTNVDDITVSAQITAQQTSCADPNGAATASVGGTTTGYTFRWYAGNNTVNEIEPGTGASISGLAAGIYTVEATNDETGCRATAVIEIEDQITPPTASASVDAHQTHCEPANGIVSATAAGSPGPFIYYWFNGNIGTPDTTAYDYKGAQYAGVAAGTYTVLAVDANTRCAAPRAVVTVNDNTSAPAIAVDIVDQGACDPAKADGQASASVGGVTANHRFRWFNGSDTTSFIAEQPVLSDLVAGTYTVKAIDRVTGCFSTQIVAIDDVAVPPTVTLSADNNSICDETLGYTGSVTATIDNDPNALPGDTYSYTWSKDGVVIPGETSATLSGVNAGTYEVIVENQRLGCVSNPISIQVEDEVELPVITTDQIASTNCDPALPNGEVSVTDVDGNGIGAPYTFRWYEGVDTSTPVVSTDASLKGIQGGAGRNYTVVVTNTTTGCENTAMILLQENQVLPVLALTPTPNNICDETIAGVAFTGAVAAAVSNQVGDIADYVFTWHDGGADTDPVIPSVSGDLLSNLPAGPYTATVFHTATGCESLPYTATVVDEGALPEIDIAQVPSTNCDPALANGSAEVTDVDNAGVGAPYTFQWYTGNVVDPANVISGATDPVLNSVQGGAGKNYTVEVTNHNNGCINTAIIQVLDNKELPVLSLTATPNDICDPALAGGVQFTGSVLAAVSNAGGRPLSEYTFAWYDGADTSTPNGSSTAELLANVPAGDYTVTALHIPTGCVSNPFTETVDDDRNLPDITTAQTPSTNCDPAQPNGEVSVTDIDGAGVAGPYTFVWYTGSGVVAGNEAGSTNPALTGVQGGAGKNYTVLVTNTSNGCQGTAITLVGHNEILPVVTLDKTDNTICAGTPDGTASVATLSYDGNAVSAPYSGYVFQWSNGATTSSIASLAAGTYTLQVTHTLGCVSSPVQVTVQDDLTMPAIVMNETPQTSCDPLNLNGEIVASVDEGGTLVTSGYAFTWYAGTGTASPALPNANIDAANPFNAISLAGNANYTVHVINNNTQCENTATVFLEEYIEIPRVELNVTQIVDCNNPGYITADVFEDLDHDGADDAVADFANYAFSWHRGSNTTSPALTTTTRVLEYLSDGVTPIPADNYTAYVVNTYTGCVSPTVTGQIVSPDPLFTIETQVNLQPASCAESEGVITAFVTDGGATTAGYSFEWYSGTITNAGQIPPATFYTDPAVSFNGSPLEIDPDNLFGTTWPAGAALPAPQAPTGTFTGPTLYGRPSGAYTVVVTDESTNCKEYTTVFLQFLEEPIVILAEITPDDCEGDNGAVSVDIQIPAVATTDPTDYKIWLIPGSNPELVPQTDPTTPFAPINVTSPTGEGNLFSDLAAGVYTIVAQENPSAVPTGCFSAPILLDLRESLPPLMTFVSSDANTNCVAPGNGALEITLHTDPNDPFHPAFPPPPPPTVVNTVPLTYAVEVRDGDNTLIHSQAGYNSGDAVTLSALLNGQYTVNVVSSLDCPATESYTIGFEPVNVDLAASPFVKQDALFCDPVLETHASITVTGLTLPGGATEPLGDYQFDWYDDAALATPVYSAMGDASPAFGGEHFANNVNGVAPGTVWAGSYWLKVTKINDAAGIGGLGCESAPLKVDIQDETEDPTVSLVAVADQSCDEVNFDGQITVTAQNTAAPAGGFEFTWVTIPGASTVVTGGVMAGPYTTDRSLGDLIGAGTYTVSARNIDTGCFAEGSVVVQNTPLHVSLTAVKNRDREVCFTDGELEVTAVNYGDLTDYVYTWTKSSPVGAALNDDFSNPIAGTFLIGGSAAGQYGDMDEGTYYVVGTRNAVPGMGCATAPVSLEIDDKSAAPTVVLTPLANTSCDDVLFEGSLMVEVTAPGSGGGTPTFTYVWDTSNPAPLNTGTPVPGNDGDGNGADDNFSGLEDGVYKLAVTNSVSQCVANVQTQILLKEAEVVVAATASPKVICNPDGEIIVTGVEVDNQSTALGDFTYTWYAGTPVSPLENSGVVITGHELTVATYPTIDAGTYYVVAQRTTNGPGYGCTSAPLRMVIEDVSENPSAVLTPFANTSCDDTFFEGSLAVEVTDPGSGPAGALFTYAWSAANPAPMNGTTLNNAGTEEVFNNLSDGLYRLLVINQASGCETQVQARIDKTEMPIVIAKLSAQPQQLCDPNPDGQVTIDEITVGGAVEADHGQFEVTWFASSPASAAIGGGQGVDQLSDLNFGTYYASVRRTLGSPGRDCESAPVMVVVDDRRKFPVVSTSSVANTSCNNNFDATITVSASTPSGPGVGASYDYIWTAVPDGSADIIDGVGVTGEYTVNAADGVGTYALTARNTVTNCFTPATVQVLQRNVPLQVLAVNKVDQTDCVPFENGSISINAADPAHINIPGTYEFTWTQNGVDITGVPDHTIASLAEGTYVVQGRKLDGIAEGCLTAPFTVAIDDLTENPVLELASIANFACDPDGLVGNGSASVAIFENNAAAPATDFDLEWFAGNVAAGPGLGTDATLAGLVQGNYTIRAVDNVSPNRGCANTATIAVGFETTTFIVALEAEVQDLCEPIQNGSVAVTTITETRGGNRTEHTDFTGFEFSWFHGDGTPHASAPVFTPGVTQLTNLTAGSYYVIARNSLGCESMESAEVVQDQTSLPDVLLENFANPAICILPPTSGYLQVIADNSLNFSDYTFEWFEGADASGPLVVANNPVLEGIQHDDPHEYTVRVTNLTTRCQSLETYRFKVEEPEIRALASATARTHCVDDDGGLYATTLEGAAALYTYQWYEGSSATGPVVFTGQEIADVPMGTYTVVAIDPSNVDCVSRPYTTEVTDRRRYPNVTAMLKNPLTHCDPALANGVAFAAVDGQIMGYTFDWFEGPVTGTPFYTGSEVAGLNATTYTVRATRIQTACEGTTEILIPSDPMKIPAPSVDVIAHHTHCVLEDGVLASHVNGNTSGYLFQWYDGNNVGSTPDGTGDYYRDLAAGWYTVTATHLVSGCVSDPARAEILPYQEQPEFDVTAEPTNCEENVGVARVLMRNNVGILDIEWDIDGMYMRGPTVEGLPKGEFTVTVTSLKECVASRSFIIIPEIFEFNGISRNGDQKNAYFEIACIQDFPRNNVKIFNRAGTLVYEANGYDNQDVFFDGVSNRGVSILGTDLPDGTYFYIIDKGDGSTPRTGYLELLSK